MAYAQNLKESDLLGNFIEKSRGNFFEFTKNTGWLADKYPHEVFVGPLFHGESRKAKVLKTVAWIVVDEDEFGEPIVEKWHIKKKFLYPWAEA